MTRVLVVDDVRDNIKLLSFELEDDGMEVVPANSGEECLRLAQGEQRPDIILLDILMPGMSGLETLRRLKADERTTDIPVIMVSSSDSEKNVINTFDLGAHDFVTKPIDYPVLAARMRSALRLSKALADLEKANNELNKLATKDPLTECYNRRYFFTLATRESGKATRHGRPLAVMMLDIDFFKQINDSYGHACGDEALRQLTQCCKDVCRDSDVIGRLGGEEFAICCPETDLAGATTLAERLRERCANMKIACDDHCFNMTLSIGVTQARDNERFDLSLQRADKLLYAAKHQGRNQVQAGAE